MADCSKCNRTDIKCCHTCKKNAEKCNVWHNCGSDCPKHEAKVITNADRIRSMSDEELAEFLLHFQYCTICDEQLEMYCTEECTKNIVAWLQSEA